jgi:hypothetical protein
LFESSAGKSSTLIAIMNALGTECSRDFLEIHQDLAMWPKIQEQLRSFHIGQLVGQADTRIQYRTWETLVAEGRIPSADAKRSATSTTTPAA